VKVAHPLMGKDLTEMWQAGGDLRAWVAYHLDRHASPAPAAPAAEAPTTTEAPVACAQEAPPPAREVPAVEQSAALPVRFPWAVRWAREMGYLAIRDMQTGEWHEVPVHQSPDRWRDEARAHKAAQRLGMKVPA
jgi:hypothetical protein